LPTWQEEPSSDSQTAVQWYGGSDCRRPAYPFSPQYLESEWATGVFSLEGLCTGWTNPEPKRGAALLAAGKKAPLLPVGLGGFQRVLKKALRWSNTGELEVIAAPILPQSGWLQAVTQQCAIAINALRVGR